MVYVLVDDEYPQDNYVSEYCPSSATYSRHVCGEGAEEWEGSGSVQYGPFSEDAYLSDDGGHCACCCQCHEVKVECKFK